jgi:hypothetical protein
MVPAGAPAGGAAKTLIEAISPASNVEVSSVFIEAVVAVVPRV